MMHYLWGSYPILFRSLLLCFYHNILWFYCCVCFWKTNLFFFGTLCHHEKCGEFGLFVGTLLSCWELVISFLDICFTFLNEISFWACVFCLYFVLIGFCLVHLLNFVINHVLIWFFDIIWTTFFVSHFCVPSWFTWCFVQIISPFGSWKYCACIFTICIFYGMLAFFDPIYRVISIKS